MKVLLGMSISAALIAIVSGCTTTSKSTGTREETMDVRTREDIDKLLEYYRVENGDVFTDNQIVAMDATQLARKIRAGEVSSVAAVVAYLKTILKENPAYNAVITINAEAALARAAEADMSQALGKILGPLHGVPFTIKDTYRSAGLRTTAGYSPLRAYLPEANAVVLQRLLNAGAILIGKTNTPRLAMDMQTTNDLFGTTNNAIDVSRTAGGSSGGSSVALARGMTAFEIGSDVGGSLRVPAAFNGVFGFRPTYGLVSMSGHIPPLPGTTNGIRRLAVAGPLARSARDLECVFKIISGPGPGDRRVSPVPGSPEETPPVQTLRIAWASELGGVPVSSDIKTAIKELVTAIQAAGGVVQEGEPLHFPYELAWETWGAILGSQGGYERSNLARAIGSFFAKSSVADSPMQRRIVGPISVPSYMESLEVQDRLMERLDDFLQEYDAWIVPISSTVAFPHMEASRHFGDYKIYDQPIVVDGIELPYYVATQSYTTIFSLTESPVVAMPIGHDESGLPIGIQLVGRRFSDYHLLAVARTLEEIVRTRKSK
jgi:amidase